MSQDTKPVTNASEKQVGDEKQSIRRAYSSSAIFSKTRDNSSHSSQEANQLNHSKSLSEARPVPLRTNTSSSKWSRSPMYQAKSNIVASFRQRIHRKLHPRKKDPIFKELADKFEIWEFLELDVRPMFIVDLEAARVNLETPKDIMEYGVVYMNKAFKAMASLDLKLLLRKLLSSRPNSPVYMATKLWGNYRIAGGDFAVIAGDEIDYPDAILWTPAEGWQPSSAQITSKSYPYQNVRREVRRKGKAEDSKSTRVVVKDSMPPSHQLLDWTRGSASRWLPEHYRVLEEMDWKRTPLGDRDDWSTSFRTIVNTIMSHPYQMIIYWSKHYVVLYNEVYVDVVRNRHPALLGTKLKESWPEAYEQIHRYLDDAMLGQNMIQIGDVIPVDRSDHPEECYFDWTLFPLIEKAGNVGGVLWQQYESTERVLHNRRKQVLVSIQASTGPVRELVDYWPAVLEAFDSNTFDSPFLLIYEVSAQTQNQGVLRGKRGVPDGHVIAPNIFLIEQNGTFFASDVIKAQIVKTKVLVEGLLGNPSLADIKSRGFCEPCLRAVVIPIFCKKDDSRIEAFIILGINPRRPFDPQYELWVDKLRFQISSDIDRLRSMKELLEERMQREVDAVNARRASELEEKLAQKEITLRKSEMKFSNMAKVIPVGILELDPQGMVTYTNDAWHDIMGIPRGEDQNTWVEHIHKDDRAWWSKRLEEALVLKEHVPVEYRLIGNDQEKWVTTEVKPMFDDSKKLSGFYSTVVDVTPLKKSQQAEKKRADEAVEANKQQERFIDMTCHELRNPLGAILQCSELIKDHVHSEREKSRHEGRAPNLKPIIESCNTIILCSQHQRRIVDDILITSKLDSNLLPVVPRSIRPMAQLEKSSKVFEAEAKKRNIKLLFHVDDSYTENNIKYVTIDPSRLWQLTSNLITNSIKFTREKDGEKTITVRVGASLTEPKSFGNVKYTERDTSEVDDGKNPIDYGEGEFLYLMVSVIDTGIGISESDQKKLFQRFQQAPKTESKYGGSGLGLYICRNLAKLQGGSIGIYSKEGEGSEFSFYVKCKRSHPTTIEAEVENNIEFITPYSEASIHDDPTSEDTATQDTIKFLVVEDNNVNRMVLKKQLEAKNCLAYTAVDGKVAVDFVRKSSLGAGSDQDAKTIDICLMDCEMPVMNGMEACQKIREMEASGELTGHLPILGVSANAREEKVEEMRASGMDDVISKPFMLSKLMEKAIQLIKIRDTAKWSATLGKAKQRDLRFASDQDILNRNEIHSDDEYGV